ncbi:MAG: thiamine pyrophosphate-dependent enzyme [Patescibacteria group bacterium]|nr:thiamine pyrophosphate-dependent enzyme [Patescibacteria group bacterium]
MPTPVLSQKNKELLLGNEAVVRGALESGLGFASTYPGTPASEIGDTFSRVFQKLGFYFEYSTNEKVALEAAAGAAFSGVKAMVGMKHYGVNVASDTLLPLAYFGCPLVVVVADDPGCWSSVQTEQDTRWYSWMGKLPTLEPANSQEAKDMTKRAFEIAWDYEVPVVVRLTTRVSHTRSLVELKPLGSFESQGRFEKPEGGFEVGSARTLELKKKLLSKISKIREEVSNQEGLNKTFGNSSKVGVVASGVSWEYLQEALSILKVEIPAFKVGMSYPFPEEMITEFMKGKEKVFVLEELDPIIESEVKRIAKDSNSGLEIHGKDWLPEVGEYKPEMIKEAVVKLAGASLAESTRELLDKFPEIKTLADAASKPPTFCAGCPHRATFWAVKQALGEDKVCGGDIGCYMLGALEPYKNQDFIVAMGAGVGISHGISKVSEEKPLVFIGDSTFFHAGIPALTNMVFNNSNALVIVMDNRLTAMTGQQPHPGTGERAGGEKCKEVLIEDVARAVGAERVEVANVYNFEDTKEKIKELYATPGVSVLVAKGKCRLAVVREMARAGKDTPKFKIVSQEDNQKLKKLDCPAIREDKGKLYIDPELCWGCAYCKQIAPNSVKPAK